jgi:hypothetical protein
MTQNALWNDPPLGRTRLLVKRLGLLPTYQVGSGLAFPMGDRTPVPNPMFTLPMRRELPTQPSQAVPAEAAGGAPSIRSDPTAG